jgi:hypothetical protein
MGSRRWERFFYVLTTGRNMLFVVKRYSALAVGKKQN